MGRSPLCGPSGLSSPCCQLSTLTCPPDALKSGLHVPTEWIWMPCGPGSMPSTITVTRKPWALLHDYGAYGFALRVSHISSVARIAPTAAIVSARHRHEHHPTATVKAKPRFPILVCIAIPPSLSVTVMEQQGTQHLGLPWSTTFILTRPFLAPGIFPTGVHSAALPSRDNYRPEYIQDYTENHIVIPFHNMDSTQRKQVRFFPDSKSPVRLGTLGRRFSRRAIGESLHRP